MAEIDSLEIKISASLGDVNAKMRETVKGLGLLAQGLSAIGRNKGLDEFAAKAAAFSSEIRDMGRQAAQSMKPISEQAKQAAKNIEQIASELQGRYKDIGKGFTFHGSTAAIQKQIDAYSNALEKAKLKKSELEASGKVEGSMYEGAIRDAMKYSNMVDSLKNQLTEMQTVQPQLNVNINGLDTAVQKVSEVAEQIRAASVPESAFNYNADAMAAVYGEAAGNIETYVRAVEKLGQSAGLILNDSAKLDIDISGVENAEQQLDSLSAQFRNMADMFSQTFTDLKSGAIWEYLTNGVKDYVRGAQLASGIKVYTDDYKAILNDIERTENELEKLAQKKRDVEAAGQGAESAEWQRVADRISAAESRLNAYAAKKQEMEASGGDVQFSGGLANASALKSMAAVGGAAIESLKQKIADIGSAVPQAVGSMPLIGRIAKESAFVGRTAFEGFKFAISGIASAASKLSSIFGAAFGGIKRLASGISGAVSKFTSLAKSMIGIKGASGGMNVSLSGGFKTVLKYAFGIRSLYALFNKMRRAAVDAFKNLAQYSPEVNASLSALSSSLGALKNSIGAAFAPILTVVTPYLTMLIDMLTRAMNAVGRFFVALTGQSFAVQSKKNLVDFAAGLSKTGGAAKKAKKDIKSYTLGIDELNIAQSESEDDEGGGGIGSGIAPEDMFEMQPVESNISDFADKVRLAWENSDFTGIGSILGEKLKNALENIPWEGIQEAAANIGMSLATLINGLVEVEGLGYSIGETVAEAVNTGLTFLDSFAKNLHWGSVGAFIADGINGALENIDWNTALSAAHHLGTGLATMLNKALSPEVFKNIGHTVGMGINAAMTFANDFLKTFDFAAFGSNIGEGLNGAVNTVDWQGLGYLFAQRWNAVFETLGNMATTFNWTNFGAGLASSVNTFITDFNWIENGANLGELLKGLLDSIISFLELTDWQALGNGVADFIGAVDWTGIMDRLSEGIGAALGGLTAFIWGLISDAWADVVKWWYDVAYEDGNFTVKGLFNGILEALKNVGTWIVEHIFNPFMDGFKTAFGIHSPSTKMSEIGGYLIEGLKNGIVNMWNAVKDKVGEVATGVIDKFKDILGIHSPSTVMDENGAYLIEGLRNGISSNMESVYALFSPEKWTEIGGQMSTALKNALGIGTDTTGDTSMFGGMLTNFESTWQTFSTKWTANLNAWKTSNDKQYFGAEEWRGNWQNFYDTYVKMWASFSAKWKSDLDTWRKNNDEQYFGAEEWRGNWQNYYDAYSEMWESFTELWQTNFKKWWSIDVEPFFSLKQWAAFGTNMKDGMYTGFKGIVLQMGGVMNGLVDVFNEGLGNIESAINSMVEQFNKNATKMKAPTLSKISAPIITKVEIPQLATGGIITSDMIFRGGELNRPEAVIPLNDPRAMSMIRNSISGDNSFASGEGFYDMVRQAAYEGQMQANNELLRYMQYLPQIAQNTRETADKDMIINLGDEQITAANERGLIARGYDFSKGISYA